MHIRFSEVAADLTVDMPQRAWSKEELGNLEGSVNVFRKILVEMFDDR